MGCFELETAIYCIILNEKITITVAQNILYPETAFGRNASVVQLFLLTNFPFLSFTICVCVRACVCVWYSWSSSVMQSLIYRTAQRYL